MAFFVCQQVFLSKRSLQKLHPSSRRCCLNYLLVLLIFLVSSASYSEAQAERCVSRPSDGTCSSNQFYNSTTSCCMQCRDCSAVNEVVLHQCNATHDTRCIPSCSNPQLQRWSVQDNKCIIIDCSLCEGGDCMNGVETCRCNRCHTGPTCTEIAPTEECRAEATNIGGDRESKGATLNPLTIGLIAIGVVIGIVAFSSCFLLFGVCTTKQRRISGENQGSENSESGLVSGRGFSNSTRSSYMSGMSSGTTAYLNHQSMLELLRHTSTPIHSVSSSSSIRSSPKSIRSSPRLVRTSPLAPSTPDKLHESGIISV
jgi:hypothetical protein